MTGGRTITHIPLERHGTVAEYNLGCRCQPCVDGKRDYQRQLYQRKKAEAAAELEALRKI